MSGFSQLLMRKKDTNILYAPALDGSEQIYNPTGTPAATIYNHMLQNGNGWLTEGWDNTVFWKLTFSSKKESGDDCCGADVILPTSTNFDQNIITITTDCQISVFNNGFRQFPNDTYFKNLGFTMSQNWLDITIEKTSLTSFIITMGGYSKEYPFNNLSATNKLCIGMHKWSNNNLFQIKDILVVKI